MQTASIYLYIYIYIHIYIYILRNIYGMNIYPGTKLEIHHFHSFGTSRYQRPRSSLECERWRKPMYHECISWCPPTWSCLMWTVNQLGVAECEVGWDGLQGGLRPRPSYLRTLRVKQCQGNSNCILNSHQKRHLGLARPEMHGQDSV